MSAAFMRDDMIPLSDLDCTCPAELHENGWSGEDEIYRPFTRNIRKALQGNNRNLIWWLFKSQQRTTFWDPNGCLCELPEETKEPEFEPHVNIARFENPSEKMCTCDPLPLSVVKYMKGVVPMGYDEDGDECVCHEMAEDTEEEVEPHVNIDRFEEVNEECFCESLPESLIKYMQGALPMGVDANGKECVCHGLDGEDPEFEPHVNIARFDEPTELECTCDPLPESVCKYMPDAQALGLDENGDECVCRDACGATEEPGVDPQDNIDRFQCDGSASSYNVQCTCDPLPENLLYMDYAYPMGVDENGEECVCCHFAAEPEPEATPEPVPEEPEVTPEPEPVVEEEEEEPAPEPEPEPVVEGEEVIEEPAPEPEEPAPEPEPPAPEAVLVEHTVFATPEGVALGTNPDFMAVGADVGEDGLPEGYYLATLDVVETYLLQTQLFCELNGVSNVGFQGGYYIDDVVTADDSAWYTIGAPGELEYYDGDAEGDIAFDFSAFSADSQLLLVTVDTGCPDDAPEGLTLEFDFCETEAALYRAYY